MPRKNKITPQESVFQPNAPIEVTNSVYSHAPRGLVGIIQQVLPDGYSVYFRRSVHIALFGGGAYRKPAVIFLQNDNMKTYKPTVQQFSFLREMMNGDFSLTRAKEMTVGREEPLKGIKLEAVLDDLWDAGLCICLGDQNLDENGLYKYRITEKGREYVGNLG